jgi:O-methyltransferase
MNKTQKLEFLKRILTDTIGDEVIRNNFFEKDEYPTEDVLKKILESDVDPKRANGMDWPERAHTMIGLRRLDNLHKSLDYVREKDIKGDFIETGVWRGGASIFIKYYNDLYNMNRKVFVVDSFEGLPLPNVDKYPNDQGDIHHTIDFLKVSLDEVKNNFNSYGLLDENVIFLKGWFEDTLKDNDAIKEISILRFDGDMYGSTMDVLNNIYHKLSKKGVLIVDDYCLPNCVKAVHDFRTQNNIDDVIEQVDSCGVFWYKS